MPISLSTSPIRIGVVVLLSLLIMGRLPEYFSSIESAQLLLGWGNVVVVMITWLGSVVGVIGGVYSPFFSRTLLAVGILGLFSPLVTLTSILFYNSIETAIGYMIDPQTLMGIAIPILILICARWIGYRTNKMDKITMDLDGNLLR